MKFLISFLIILLFSVLIGLFANHDTGYVLFGRGKYTLELSLTLFVVLQLVAFISLYAAIRIIIKTWQLPKVIRRWNQHYVRDKAHLASSTGLIHLAQGQWKKAENTLIKNAKNSDTPLINYLSAARAAQKMNAPERRDNYLALAQAEADKNKILKSKDEFAIQLTQAELQMAHGEMDQALLLLNKLYRKSPHHSQILYLLYQLYTRTKDYLGLQEILSDIKKQKLIPQDELFQVEKDLYLWLLNNLNDDEGSKLIKLWKTIPKVCQKEDHLIEVYIQLLIQVEKFDIANSLLKTRLKNNFSEKFVLMFSTVTVVAAPEQLEFLELFLQQNSKNAVLLLSLGKVAKRCELWGKAQSYLEASIGIQPRRETYRELGELLEKLGETTKAAICFRDGLFLIEKQQKIIPIKHDKLKLISNN